MKSIEKRKKAAEYGELGWENPSEVKLEEHKLHSKTDN